MSLLSGLRYVLVAIALLQSALCDEQGDEIAVASSINCTIENREGEILSANASMYVNLEGCFSLVEYVHLGPSPSDELIRSTFATVCNKTALLSKCMDDVDSEAIECLDSNELQRHRLYRRYRELEFGAGCEDNGADMTDVYRFQFQRDIAENFMVTCQAQAVAQLGAMDEDGANRFTLYKYRVLLKTVECLGAHKRGARDIIANWGITLCNKVAEAMKCVDHEGADVLCKTIA